MQRAVTDFAADLPFSKAMDKLYIERWLKADVLMPDGTLMTRDKGTPQGGVISPVLAEVAPVV